MSILTDEFGKMRFADWVSSLHISRNGVYVGNFPHLNLIDAEITVNDDGSLTVVFTGSLAELSDVAINSPTNGQILSYNSSSGKWINAKASSFLLMQDGVTRPPVPLENEDGTDWIYAD